MANNCPNCDKRIDTNRNYDCPKCGYKFWQSREAFEKCSKNLPPIIESENNIKNEAIKKEKTESTSFLDKLLTFVAFWALSFIPTALILFIIGLLLGDNGKCGDNHPIPLPGFCSAWKYIWLYSLLFSGLLWIWKIRTDRSRKIKTILKANGSEKPRQVSAGKIHCHKCGKKIDDDSNFCIYCGSKITGKKHQ